MDGIILFPFKGQQAGTDQRFTFRQAAKSGAKTVREGRKDMEAMRESPIMPVPRAGKSVR